ncbi:intraflagellar transport protein rempA [Dermatophagoides farinae]|uniref:intraflagellar transport protein rempA n=1 Tax=Dermatophagoides farinae TaxID=6954 RepID=UPI003F63CB7A
MAKNHHHQQQQRTSQRSGNLVAFKSERNQVTIDDLKKHEMDNNNNEQIVVTCDSSIKMFTLNEKDCLMAIILDDNDKIILYDTTLNRRIEHHNQMKLIQSFELLFIHLGALWSGRMQQSMDNNNNNRQLEFQIQQINDFSQMSLTVPSDHHHHYHLCGYHVNKDMLLYSIIHYQILDSRDLQRKNHWPIYDGEGGKINPQSLQTNWNNTLIAFTIGGGNGGNSNVINIIDLNDNHHRIIEYKIPIQSSSSSSSSSPIIAIEFDSIHHHSFCVSTRQTFHFCFYSPENNGRCYRYDSIAAINNENNNKNNSIEQSEESVNQLVAYKIPDLYIFKMNNNNGICIIKNKHQQYYLNKREYVENMLINSDDENHFRKYLYCDSKNDDDDDEDNYELWRLMARKCVMEKNIDWTFICLAKMGNVGLVRTLRQEMATQNGHHQIVLFLMMIHLDLIEESEQLLLEIEPSQRCKLYCLQEKWPKAFECADKIELKNLHYQYGKQMEMENRIMDSINYFERADNVGEIVRMLFENENIVDLKNYCLKKKNEKYDTKLVSWWGQYCESQCDHSKALEMYRLANDHYNLVRLLCHLGQKDKAIELVDDYLQQRSDEIKLNDNIDDDHDGSGSETPEMTGAILFLGKHLESIDSLQSIDYYLHCSAIRHAIRVCIAYEHYDKLVMIAIKYLTMNECRNIIKRYFPLQNDFQDKMVSEENMAMLYYKADLIKQAILFAIKYRLWPFLRRCLQEELEKDERRFISGQDEIDLIIEYLREDNSIVDIVIDLILLSSNQEQFDSITQLIHQFGIDLNDQIMEKLEQFVSKHSNNQSLMNTIAELCLEKGNYQLAAKLYNKIGKRVDSIKALIRTGQSDKIIQFANVARDRTVFKLAANFLQTINYEDTDQVIRFYTKAQAEDELARYRETLQQ